MYSSVPTIGAWGGVKEVFESRNVLWFSDPRENREKPLELSIGLAVTIGFGLCCRLYCNLSKSVNFPISYFFHLSNAGVIKTHHSAVVWLSW